MEATDILTDTHQNGRGNNAYRGIENPFGHIGEWKWADGVLVREGVPMPDRPKTPYEQRWGNLSDLQEMQLQGLLEHYSEKLTQQ